MLSDNCWLFLDHEMYILWRYYLYRQSTFSDVLAIIIDKPRLITLPYSPLITRVSSDREIRSTQKWSIGRQTIQWPKEQTIQWPKDRQYNGQKQKMIEQYEPYLYNIIVIITLNVFGDLKKWNLSKMYW